MGLQGFRVPPRVLQGLGFWGLGVRVAISGVIRVQGSLKGSIGFRV